MRSPHLLLAVLLALLPPFGCVGPPGAPPARAASAAAATPERARSGGINERFLAADLDVDELVQLFEAESREIAAHRRDIVAALELRPGERVADIGAGTGLFLELLADAVGPSGVVYAVDISPRLVEFMHERAMAAGWSQVEAVLCSERSIDLPHDSIDLAFVCDTYHHFEHPVDTLESIYRALVPGGRLVVVDFERIPGVSRQWVLDHVRAGKETFAAEIRAAGFEPAGELQVPGLAENYVLRFLRP